MKIFSNYDMSDYENEARDNLASEYDEKPSENEVYDLALSYMEDDWYNLIDKVLIRNIEQDGFVALGSIGRWDGRYGGWTVLRDSKDFYNLIESCHYLEVEDRDGRLFLTASHHDGTNQFELMRFVNDGLDFYYEHDELTNKEMIDTLIEKHYLEAPKIIWEY